MVYKTKYDTAYKLRDWKIRRDGLCAMYYHIPGAPDKNVSTRAFEWAYKKLSQGRNIKREDFPKNMSSDVANCNFTVLGGIFHQLGYAQYPSHIRGTIISKCDTTS